MADQSAYELGFQSVHNCCLVDWVFELMEQLSNWEQILFGVGWLAGWLIDFYAD